MKSLYASIVNVILTVIFGIVLSWMILFTACIGSDAKWCKYEKKYLASAGFISSLIMVHFLFVQLNLSTDLLHSKRRPFPIKNKKDAKIFHYVSLLMDKEQDEKTKRDDLRDIGWTVEFEDGVPVFISVFEMSKFLLSSCMNQKKIDMYKKTNIKSPLSQRSFPGLGRRKLRAYKRLLRDSGVIVYHNSNVERLIRTDPWKILEEIRKVNPENKIVDN